MEKFKQLRLMYPELKTTSEAIKRYRQEHYVDDPLGIMKGKPSDPEAELNRQDGPKVVIVESEIDPKMQSFLTDEQKEKLAKNPLNSETKRGSKMYNLFRDVFPKKDCPKCGHKKSMQLRPLCGGCKEAQVGKFKTAWRCLKCGHEEVSEKGITQWWKELTGGKEFYANLPDGHGFIPKIYLDDERKVGD
jgi:predicted nucleic-acid-binding Zn-ribbon protein